MITGCWPPILALGFALAGQGAEQRFRPETVFPDGLAYASVASIERLIAGFNETLAGRLAAHPGVRAALGTLPDRARQAILESTAGFTGDTGMDLFQALGLLRGELALAVVGLDPEPRVALALELGPRRAEILALFEKLDRAMEAKEAQAVARSAVEGVPAVEWRAAGGQPQIARVILGTHLVFAAPPDLLPPIVLAHAKSGAAPGAAAASKEIAFLAAVRPGLGLERLDFIAAFNIGALRALSENPNAVEERELLRRTGLDGVSALGFAGGFRNGLLETKLHLATPGGLRGFVAALAESLAGGPTDLAGLELVPDCAGTVASLRLHPGRLAEAIVTVMEAVAPDPSKAPAPGGGVRQQLEARLGMSLANLKKLPALAITAFTAAPPAGSLFSDGFAFVRTEELEPYRSLLEKVEGGAARQLEAEGRKIHYFPVGAYVPLADGWTLVSTNTIALRRYLAHFSKSRKVAASPDAARELRDLLSGSQASLVLREGSVLPIYNTVVSFLTASAPSFEPYLSLVGADPGLLPPGEEFMGPSPPGFLRLSLAPGGVTFHARGLISRSGWLPLVAGGGIAAAVAIPILVKARSEAEHDPIELAPPQNEPQKTQKPQKPEKLQKPEKPKEPQRKGKE